MIGVIPKVGQEAVIEEFFELFKTPWEFYKQGRAYDVVLAAANDIPEVDARLILVYGSEIKSIDAREGITECSRHSGGSLSYQGIDLPVYSELLTFEQGRGTSCAAAKSGIAGLRLMSAKSATVLRFGYDLFQEVQFLLSHGQPVEQAHIPTLDLHIRMLRSWILNEGIALLEIPPVPAGHNFAVCLTHDIDFVGIRNHKFDHTMWGFLYRSTVGAVRELFRGRISVALLFGIWRAAASLPLVFLGLAKDFWEPFEWYLRVEKGLPATYFLIPFKRRKGNHVPGRHASRRASAYDVSDLPQWTAALQKEHCELGVHGIDAWHSVEKGREELARIAAVTGKSSVGIRMHWLLRNENTLQVLEEAGYAYDSTVGYNETIGYRAGTAQVFRPIGAKALLESPMHIQDGALFFPGRLDLPEPEAEKRCQTLVSCAIDSGGVLTLLWHDRSHGPERFWGNFYAKLVQTLRSLNPWFGTAGQVVGWFRKRRDVRFVRTETMDGTTQLCLRYTGEQIVPPLNIRIHRPYAGAGGRGERLSDFVDISWNGETGNELDRLLQGLSGFSAKPGVPVGPDESDELITRKGQAAPSLL